VRLARQVAHILNEEIELQLKDVAGTDALKAFLEAKAGFGVARKVADVAERQGVAGLLGNRKFGLSSNIIGAAAGATHGLGAGLVGAELNRVALERGPSTLAWLASEVSQSPTLATAAQPFAPAPRPTPALD